MTVLSLARSVEAPVGSGSFGTLDISRPILSLTSFTTGILNLQRFLGAPQTMVLELTGAPTGLVGTLTTMLEDDEGVVIYPETTVGVSENPEGTGRYLVTMVVPDDGTYFVFWSDGVTVRTARIEVTGGFAQGGLPFPTTSTTLLAHGWLPGTVVEAYPGEGQRPGAHPAGPVETLATVAEDQSLTFAGLAPGRRFIAWAADRSVAFRADEVIDSRITGQPAGVLRRGKVEQLVSAFQSIDTAALQTLIDVMSDQVAANSDSVADALERIEVLEDA